MISPGTPIRLGLLLDEPAVPWWVAPALRQALDDGKIVIPFAAIRATPQEPRRESRPIRWWRNRDHLGLALYEVHRGIF